MGADLRCPFCLETFFAGGATNMIECPACGERHPRSKFKAVAPGTPPTAAAAPAPAAAAAAAKRVFLKACPSCAEQYPVKERTCPACGTSYRVAKSAQAEEAENPGFAPEKAGIRKGVLGGVIMLVIAAVWFFAGLAADRIFFYPPILAIMGVYAIIKGLATGNLAGQKAPPIRRRVRRPE